VCEGESAGVGPVYVEIWLTCVRKNAIICVMKNAKIVRLAKNAERGMKDYALTRYACYLIAQNGDSRKMKT